VAGALRRQGQPAGRVRCAGSDDRVPQRRRWPAAHHHRCDVQVQVPVVEHPGPGRAVSGFKEAGLTRSQVKAAGKYTWHHLDDFDPATGRGTMQLITQSAHKASLPHTGSVAQFEKHFGLSSGAYGTSEAVGIAQDKGWLRGRPQKNNIFHLMSVDND